MKTGTPSTGDKLASIIEYASRLHGHLGPFLILGVKISLVGMKKLEIEGNTRQLRVEVELPHQVPYTCTLDGIQATTQCTFGNQKLSFKEVTLPMITTKFSLNGEGRQVIISVKNEVLQDLMEKLKGAKENGAFQEKLAWMIASMPEEKLFSIRVQ